MYPTGDTAIHLRQLPDGRVLIGERSQDKTVTEPTKEHARALLAQAARALPILRDTDVDRFTVEWRPMPRDKMPVVGPLPGLSDLYIATGHSGVTIAPALAECVAKEVAEDIEHDRLKPFRPARFSVHNADAYASIAEAFSM
ncbi:MAG: NAD(P)/FAD-dependent oxidoreductase [Actinomycetota bacterium]